MTEFLSSILTGAYPNAGGGESRMGRKESDRVASHPIPARQLDEDDMDLLVDPQEHVIVLYGHRRYYTTHQCPSCEAVTPCTSKLCKQPFTIECLTCATHDVLGDVERIAKETREFIKAFPTPDYDAQTLMWWKALRSEVDGKLKGLAERANEVLKREVRS